MRPLSFKHGVHPQTRAWLSMPTLVVCAVACLALVMLVGMQAPAVSVGLRWEPGPRSTARFIPIELFGDITLVFGGPPENGWPHWLTWASITLAIVLMLMALARWIRRLIRRPPTMNVARMGADSGATTEADARILQSGLAAAIEILDAEGERDPGNAVVKAWQGLQDAAASAGLHRRPAETTSEFTARILYRSRGSSAPIAVLLSLYQRVRFGEHMPNADEIAAAQNSLAILVNLWRADFPERRQAKVGR